MRTLTARRTRADVLAFGVAAASIVASPTRAAETAARPLVELGMELDAARALVGGERLSAIEAVHAALGHAIDNVARSRRAAARFLAGEILHELGRHEEARRAFEGALDDAGGGPLADDAWTARIDAMEAAGDDERAAREWRRWEEANAESALRSEVRLARAQNDIRRGDATGALAHLDELARTAPHLARDPRVLLARGTIALVQDRPEDALAVTAGVEPSAALHFLTGLARAAVGRPLEAAASYQEVVNRFPHSPLRDHALFAKADIFFASGGYTSAIDAFTDVIETVAEADLRAEAALRRAASIVLDGDAASGVDALGQVVAAHAGTQVAARAQYLLAEVLWNEDRHDDAILAFNEVLTHYFEHELAASAQYRIARCLDALGRHGNATGAYQAVTTGYPLAEEAPAASYLAGVGLFEMGKPLAAAPYFQLVLDRYMPAAGRDERTDAGDATVVFDSPEHQELVEAALCMLELSYHTAGDLGRLSGAPHVMLQRMPPSNSIWRAYATLIDADALAASGRHDEAEAQLASLMEAVPEARIAVPAGRLLAWSQARAGRDDLAIATEQSILERYGSEIAPETLASAHLNRAHVLFNRKAYADAAAAYERFVASFPDDPARLDALYQAGVCYTRLDRHGDAVDRWEAIVAAAPGTELAVRALARAGDVYFQAESFEDARRCYRSLLELVGAGGSTALAHLRLAQCDYNAGRDAEALDGFSQVAALHAGTPFATEASRGIERTLYRLGQREDSIDVLSALVDRFPTSAFAADAQLEVASRLYEAGRFAEAASAYRRVVTQFPGHDGADEAHFFMAEALLQGGELDAAARALEQFVIFFPESELRPVVEFRVAAARFERGEYMSAAVAFNAVLDAEPDEETRAAALFNLALCRRLLGAHDEAVELFGRLRSEHDGGRERAVDIAYQLADMHEERGETELALAEFERALASGAPASLGPEINYRIGHCRERLGMEDAAAAAYRQAIASRTRTDPFRISALVRCAALYEKSGEYERAVAAYRDLAKNADDPELVAGASERINELSTVVQ